MIFNEKEREIFEFILDNIPDAITVIDTHYRTLFFNKMSEDYFQVKKESIIGRDLREFFPDSLLPKVIDTQQAFYNIYNKPRKDTYTVISAIPMYNNQGDLIGGLARDKDITEFVKLSEILSKTQDSLSELEREYNRVLQGENHFSHIISNNPEFIELINLCKNLSRSNMNILVTGESGTGKELFVRAIHHESGRKGKLVPLNCSAIPMELFESELFGYEEGAFTGAKKGGKIGKFEEANGGTLFLDEIGDMPLTLQPKILRALEEGYITRIGGSQQISVDVRIISATHQDMEGLIKKSKFRKDLFYRLNSFQVQLIPLRERKEDIYLLTNKFLQQYCMENGMNILEVPEQIHHVLKHHHWEGNVRELRNVIQRAVLLAKQHQSGRVLPNYLPDYLTNKLEPLAMEEETGGLDQAINQYEIRLIQDALNRYNNNKKKAAEFLKIPRATLYYKMEKHNISV